MLKLKLLAPPEFLFIYLFLRNITKLLEKYPKNIIKIKLIMSKHEQNLNIQKIFKKHVS